MKKGEHVRSLFFLLAIILSITLVSASLINVNYVPPQGSGRLATDPIDTSTWYGSFLVNWLGFGETWALVLASLMVMLILVSGIYDILYGFSAFSNKTVIFIIALGVSVIVGLSGAIRAIAITIFGLVGGLGAISIAIGIIIPLVIFIIVNVLFYRMFAELHTKKNVADIKSGAEDVAAAAEALGTAAGGFRKARTAAEK